MDRKVLLLYLKDIRDLEFAKYKIDMIYADEQRKYYETMNELQDYKTVEIPDEKKDNWSSDSYIGFLIGFAGLFMELIAFMQEGVKLFDFGDVPVGLAVFALIFWNVICVGLIMFSIASVQNSAKANKEDIENRKRYNQEVKLANERNREMKPKVNYQWRKRSAYLKSEKSKVEALLQNYYGLNILANPYRNLASVYYIYDYMSSCQDSLKETLIHEHMENGIQRILEKLDDVIRSNEEMILRTRVLESHSKRIIEQNEEILKSAERMNESNDLIVENTALIANYSKVNAYFSLANYLK